MEIEIILDRSQYSIFFL